MACLSDPLVSEHVCLVRSPWGPVFMPSTTNDKTQSRGDGESDFHFCFWMCPPFLDFTLNPCSASIWAHNCGLHDAMQRHNPRHGRHGSSRLSYVGWNTAACYFGNILPASGASQYHQKSFYLKDNLGLTGHIRGNGTRT